MSTGWFLIGRCFRRVWRRLLRQASPFVVAKLATVVALPIFDFDATLTFSAFAFEWSGTEVTVAIFVRPGCRTRLRSGAFLILIDKIGL